MWENYMAVNTSENSKNFDRLLDDVLKYEGAPEGYIKKHDALVDYMKTASDEEVAEYRRYGEYITMRALYAKKVANRRQ